MPEPPSPIDGRHILVIEDEFLIAEDLREALEALGAVVIGPAATADDALALIGAAERLDGATVDVTLRGERSDRVAAALRERHIPFVLLTGYGSEDLPPQMLEVPRCRKPFDIDEVVDRLSG